MPQDCPVCVRYVTHSDPAFRRARCIPCGVAATAARQDAYAPQGDRIARKQPDVPMTHTLVRRTQLAGALSIAAYLSLGCLSTLCRRWLCAELSDPQHGEALSLELLDHAQCDNASALGDCRLGAVTASRDAGGAAGKDRGDVCTGDGLRLQLVLANRKSGLRVHVWTSPGGAAYVVWRASANLRNWASDLDVVMARPRCPQGVVGRGAGAVVLDGAGTKTKTGTGTGTGTRGTASAPNYWVHSGFQALVLSTASEVGGPLAAMRQAFRAHQTVPTVQAHQVSRSHHAFRAHQVHQALNAPPTAPTPTQGFLSHQAPPMRQSHQTVQTIQTVPVHHALQWVHASETVETCWAASAAIQTLPAPVGPLGPLGAAARDTDAQRRTETPVGRAEKHGAGPCATAEGAEGPGGPGEPGGPEEPALCLLAAALSRLGRATLVFTGDSLGGACAPLCAWFLQGTSPMPHVITFGAPRYSNAEFAAAVVRRTASYRRFVAEGDLVPQVPFYIGGVFPYAHACGTERYVPRGVASWDWLYRGTCSRGQERSRAEKGRRQTAHTARRATPEQRAWFLRHNHVGHAYQFGNIWTHWGSLCAASERRLFAVD